MGPTGQNNLSQKSSTSRTPNGYSATSHSMTMADEITIELESLAGLAPEDVPAESRFLLEINFSDLNNSNVETQQYWILAINAALTEQRLQRARGARSKRILDKVNRKLPSRTKMGIVAV